MDSKQVKAIFDEIKQAETEAIRAGSRFDSGVIELENLLKEMVSDEIIDGMDIKWDSLSNSKYLKKTLLPMLKEVEEEMLEQQTELEEKLGKSLKAVKKHVG